jgi:hypothetical protein
MQNGPHDDKADHTSFYVISKLFTQTFLIGRGDVAFLHIAYTKYSVRAIQETVFSVANADFEDGENYHGYGDCIFLVIYAQPSRNCCVP